MGERSEQATATTTTSNPDGLGTGGGTGQPIYGYTDASYPTNGQYSMVFLEGSDVTVEWTAQHGCAGADGAGNYVNNCNYVIQYTCDTDNTVITDPAQQVELRDGGVTTATTRPTAPTFGTNSLGGAAIVAAIQANNGANLRGRHKNEVSLMRMRRPTGRPPARRTRPMAYHTHMPFASDSVAVWCVVLVLGVSGANA